MKQRDLILHPEGERRSQRIQQLADVDRRRRLHSGPVARARRNENRNRLENRLLLLEDVAGTTKCAKRRSFLVMTQPFLDLDLASTIGYGTK